MRSKFIRSILVFQIIICLTIFSFQASYAQAQDGIDYLKNVIPPSPNAMAMAKYGDWPVGLFTGVANINLDITTLKTRSIKIPVSLTYHASGNKVSDIASSVGLGFSLSGADGIISRTIRGIPDEGNLFSQSNSYTNPNDLSTVTADYIAETRIVGTAQGQDDSEQDIYNFSALGKSYRLLLQADGTVYTIPYSNVKVLTNPINNGTGNGIPSVDGWTVLMEDGTKIIFGGVGYTETTQAPSQRTNLSYTSSWHIQSVITTTGEIINYTYYPSVQVTQDGYFSESDNIKTSSGCGNSEFGTHSQISIQYVNTLNLKSIESDLERLEFKMQGNRLDLIGGMLLGEIKLYSKIFSQYTEEYWFNYNYSQAVSTQVVNVQGIPNTSDLSQRLKLQSMVRKDTLGQSQPLVWSFGYNTQKLPSRRSYAQDYWGYYNGANNNTLLPPESGFASPIHNTGANRNGNITYMQAEILDTIRYPTKGYTVFNYEGNSSFGQLTGGLRVTSIIDYDGKGGVFNSKSYQYGSALVIAPVDAINDYLTSQTNYSTSCTYVNQTRNSSSHFVRGDIQGGTTGYGQVTTLYGLSGQNGYTVSTFNTDADIGTTNGFPYPPPTSAEVHRGLLLTQYDYNAQSVLLKKVDNNYSFNLIKQFNGFKAGYFSTYDNCQNVYGNCGITYLFYQIPCEQVIHNFSTETIYDTFGATSLATTTYYYYDFAANTQPDRTITFDSKGDTIIQYMRTAFEMPTTAIIKSMVNKNMVTQFLQREKRNNTNMMSRKTVNYDSTWLLTSSILPQSEQIQNGTGAPYTSLTINSYDAKGNITSLTSVEGVTKNYLWDYSSSKPIAEVINTSPNANDFAYTSFETGSGNWYTFSLAPTTSGFTGGVANNLAVSTNNLSYSNLISAKSYRVSLWALASSNPSILVNGVAVAGSDNRNGWTLYQTTITGTTSVTISGAAIIDELRVCPSASQMTTYTYGPYGITSSTDPNNVTNYYQYDGMGRLITTRDDKNKILKTFQYHYQTN